MFDIKFWGVRGSIPSPLSGAQVRGKMDAILLAAAKDAGFLSRLGVADTEEKQKACIADFVNRQPFWMRSTYGGNTSCVSVRHGEQFFVFDMGTGARELGNSLMPQVFRNHGMRATFLFSHVHADHTQGVPFFGPLYVNKAQAGNEWLFVGGTDWQQGIEWALASQMGPPGFPVPIAKIKDTTASMRTETLYDQKRLEFDDVVVVARELHHPQETYGFRLTDNDGGCIVYATDNEPFDPLHPDPRLLWLVRDANVVVIDCQYSKKVYEGNYTGGVPRHGWGHSYPEAVAQVAVSGRVEKMILFHHDPSSTDEQIEELRKQTEQWIYVLGGKTEVFSAYEGMELVG